MCGYRPVFSLAKRGRLHHGRGERHERHRHRSPFIALVLRGSYVEAGDAGPLSVVEGDIVVHGAFEAHMNCAGAHGADVLLLPTDAGDPSFGTSANFDEIVRLSERDVATASELARRTLISKSLPLDEDWPERLARDLLADRDVCLQDWARGAGLRPETLSRGFRRTFGCTPSAYRASVRALSAWRALRSTLTPLKAIAAEHGFSDQSHFTKSIAALTGHSPARWRKSPNANAAGSSGYKT